VDCDLRRPRLHKFFGLPNDVGFTSLLLGEVGLDEVVRDVVGQPNLKLLPSGRVPPNPSELLSGRRTQEVLTVLASQADVILIDSPPIVPVTDAAVLAPRVDGILLVTSIGISTRRNLARAVQILRRVEAPLSGVVLNRSIDDDTYTYYNYTETYTSPGSASDDNGSTNGKRRYAHAGEVKRQGTQLPDL
jgi:non-specific protein-tyrosine kinase